MNRRDLHKRARLNENARLEISLFRKQHVYFKKYRSFKRANTVRIIRKYNADLLRVVCTECRFPHGAIYILLLTPKRKKKRKENGSLSGIKKNEKRKDEGIKRVKGSTNIGNEIYAHEYYIFPYMYIILLVSRSSEKILVIVRCCYRTLRI